MRHRPLARRRGRRREIRRRFSDISHFNRLFRARFGDTPSGVRAQRQTSEPDLVPVPRPIALAGSSGESPNGLEEPEAVGRR